MKVAACIFLLFGLASCDLLYSMANVPETVVDEFKNFTSGFRELAKNYSGIDHAFEEILYLFKYQNSSLESTFMEMCKAAIYPA